MVHYLLERLARLSRFFIQQRGNVVVESKSGSHIMMLLFEASRCQVTVAASETPLPSTTGSTAKSGPKRYPAAGTPSGAPASESAPDDAPRAKTYTRTSFHPQATREPNFPAKTS